MDAEEHSVIMQQVKELEVRSEMVSSQYAAAQGGGPHIGVVLGGCSASQHPCSGFGVRGALGCAGGVTQELFAGLSGS